MDLPFTFDFLGANPEPDNALTIAWYVTYKSPPTKMLFYFGDILFCGFSCSLG